MKNSLKTTILTFAGACFLFQACDTSVTRVTYVPDHDGVSFVQSSISDTEIDANAETWSFDIARAKADSDLTVDLTVDASLQNFVPSSVTFAAGEYTAQISVDVSGLEIGTNLSGTVAITEGQDCYDTNTAITSVSLSLQKAYEWESLGTGQWNDYLFMSDVILDVNVYYNGSVYRVYDPWPTDVVLADWGDDLEVGNVPSYVDFTVNNDGSISWVGNTSYSSYAAIATGYTYVGYGEIYYLPTSAFSSYQDYTSYTDEDGNVFVINWVAYIPDYGGGFGVYTAYLALPDYTGDLEDYISSQ